MRQPCGPDVFPGVCGGIGCREMVFCGLKQCVEMRTHTLPEHLHHFSRPVGGIHHAFSELSRAVDGHVSKVGGVHAGQGAAFVPGGDTASSGLGGFL